MVFQMRKKLLLHSTDVYLTIKIEYIFVKGHYMSLDYSKMNSNYEQKGCFKNGKKL